MSQNIQFHGKNRLFSTFKNRQKNTLKYIYFYIKNKIDDFWLSPPKILHIIKKCWNTWEKMEKITFNIEIFFVLAENPCLHVSLNIIILKITIAT